MRMRMRETRYTPELFGPLLDSTVSYIISCSPSAASTSFFFSPSLSFPSLSFPPAPNVKLLVINYVNIQTGLDYKYLSTDFVHPWLAAQALNAFNTTSTILCEVNTFPAHTAAVGEGSNNDFLGNFTVLISY